MKKFFVKIFAAAVCAALLTACGSGDAQLEETAWSDIASSDALSSASSGQTSDEIGSSQVTEPASSDIVSSDTSSASSSKHQSSSKNGPLFTQSQSDSNSNRYSGTRDPYYWPFSETSIWNMPIGSGAKLEKAGFTSAYCMSIDDEYIVKVSEGDPVVNVYPPSSWSTRWPGDTSRLLGTLQVPYDFTLADARQGHTPNNCTTFIMPNGRTLVQLQPCCRVEKGKQIVGWMYKDVDIYGDGIGGTHYGSGLSAFGGSIRKGELISDEPIKHAIKLNVHAKKYLYYDKSTEKGYIWPADRHDSYATTGNNAYGGSNPKLRMGTLLTIPKNITAESLGITTAVGKKLFYALQNYGCYIVDDSAWDCYAWSAESGVRDEVMQKYGINLNTNSKNNDAYYRDSQKLISSLYIVTNNSPSSIGGGGTPCKPLAPAFK